MAFLTPIMYILTMRRTIHRLPDPTRLGPLGGAYEAATFERVTRYSMSPRGPMRLFPRYALVHIDSGRGRYQDDRGRDAPLEAGDTVLVLPTLAHRYYPHPADWSETYIVFDGPVFRLWDSGRLLTERLCLTTQAEGGPDRSRFEWVLEARNVLEEVIRLQTVLGELVAAHATDRDAPGSTWLSEARQAIERLLHTDDAAHETAKTLGLSERAFRRRFRQEAGIGVKQFQDERRMAHACELMANSTLLDKQIANRLGYRDPLHFSRRFHQIVGCTPTTFRRGLYRGG